jgi:rubrerythrin
MPITGPADLRQHLKIALEVELSTVPPYLYAMYSIEDRTSEAALLIRSILAEEMLHAALVANLLLAVGGRPRFETTEHMPIYPGMLPNHKPPLRLHLVPASPDVIANVFMRIEQPAVHGAPAEPDEYETLGQFYHALELAIEALADSHDLFSDAQPERQMADPSFYSPVAFDAEDSGGLVLIDNVDAALEAIETIVHQGEGLSTARWADPAHQELTHYHKLRQIADGTSPLGTVLPLRHDPRAADYPPDIRAVADLFNLCYRYTFVVLSDIYGPNSDKGPAVTQLYGLMSTVMSDLAYFLVRQPLGDGTVAGPTFEVVDIGEPPLEALLNQARATAERHEELTTVVAAIEEMSGA